MKLPIARVACVVSVLAIGACDRSSSSANAPATPPPAAPETPAAPPTPPPAAAVDVTAPPATPTPAAATDAGSSDVATADATTAVAAADAASPPAGTARGEGAAHASARAHERAAPNSAVAAPAPAATGEPAELRLRIVPSGSIELDGHAVGEDFYRGNVPPGRHTVRVQNTERQASRTMTINLAPGEHAMRTIDLTRAE